MCYAGTCYYELAKMTPGEMLKVVLFAKDQHALARIEEPINCAGASCDRRVHLLHMFRCYFCLQYFCPICAGEHFGPRSERR
jgi:hypothetical protein